MLCDGAACDQDGCGDADREDFNIHSKLPLIQSRVYVGSGTQRFSARDRCIEQEIVILTI